MDEAKHYVRNWLVRMKAAALLWRVPLFFKWKERFLLVVRWNKICQINTQSFNNLRPYEKNLNVAIMKSE